MIKIKKELLILVSIISYSIFAQNIKCKITETNTNENNNSRVKAKIKWDQEVQLPIITDEDLKKEFIIPVVFHVFDAGYVYYPETKKATPNAYYETDDKKITTEKIKKALEKVNEDFNGLNDDYDSVDPDFEPIKSKLNIKFELAKIGKRGNDRPEGCVNFYDKDEKGFGKNTQTIKDLIQTKYAWDNNKYINVYIQNDLFDDQKNNSGVATYPDQEKTKNNFSRIVYSGTSIYGNTDVEFASTLTHEFAHFLGLIHTFENGCAGTDEVDDTPQEDSAVANTRCMSAINCNREKINSENYMGYNGSHGCYKMFTKGQVQRMYKALHHSSREKLWQKENLIDTGLMERDLLANNQFDKQATLNIYPNPFNSNIEISIDEKIKEAKLFTILGEEILVNLHPLNENLIHIERLESLKTGLYIIKITTLSGKIFSKKMTKK
ncbi:T9SS type A sorting domain-containing protein [Flavobacterium columnare]|uniref:M43 family zinc metalloprotease n=1 Tax=Flavobacterium columnare TaxID=996 RepID=UPI002D20D0C2|nr:M43 family zinc metalloprotease [Flavobacterium columnare]MEB3802289.1 T9SS type A sorting domain-containing protein [Flavobacterium columnare]